MAREEIYTFDASSMENIARMWREFGHRLTRLEQRQPMGGAPQPQVQPIIGKAVGEAGAVADTYKIDIHHGPYRNGAGDDDGEFAAYRVEAKPWAGDTLAPVAGTKVMLWQAPFGQWYFIAMTSRQIVQVYHGSTAGVCVQKNSSGYHPGRLRDWTDGTVDNGADVWIKIIECDAEQTTREQAEFQATLAGTATHSDSERPLYIVVQGGVEFKAKADADIAVGSSGTVSIWTNGSDSTVNVTAYFDWAEGGDLIQSAAEILIRWFDDEAHWYVIPLSSTRRKPLVLFSLDDALTVSDASQDATISAQYGAGVDNDDTAITVYNMYTGSAYMFEGASGAWGLAYHDQGQNYRIVQMQCPE